MKLGREDRRQTAADVVSQIECERNWRAQAALSLFLVDPNCTLFGALTHKSAACRALTQRAVDLRLQITLPIGPGTLLLAAVTPRFVATTVSRILPLRQRERCQKLFFHRKLGL